MKSDSSYITSVPTNIITGFLGAGKTSAILHLLTQKPQDERWAILVNEFGEVGIDGSLFGRSEENGIFTREVPGGCMCCAAGLPMQIALNMLLSRARPHRLLIEPTGLGHPREVLEVLSAEHYQDVLDLRATVTLVDARKVHDSRYTSHGTFNQQLTVADVIVANKADQYQAHDFPALRDYLNSNADTRGKAVFQVEQGALKMDWLEAPASVRQSDGHHHHHPVKAVLPPLATPMPECGYLSIKNAGDGFYSRGWIFDPSWIFDAQKLRMLLLGLTVERAKGVLITHEGVIAYNKSDDVLTESELDDNLDSRIECISSDPAVLEGLEAALLECVATRSDWPKK